MNGMTAFFVAIGVAALACFALMIRADRIRNRRQAYADSAAGDSSNFSSASDGSNLLNWFGGSSNPSDSTCASSDSGSSDSSCGDSGGGGDGGGGGSSD